MSYSLAELRGLAAALRPSLTVAIESTDPDARIPEAVARVLLNVLLVAADGLPRGGHIAVSGSGAEDFLITIEGPRAAWPTQFANCLLDLDQALALLESPDPAQLRSMQASLTALLACAAKIDLSMLLPTGFAGPAPLRLRSASVS